MKNWKSSVLFICCYFISHLTFAQSAIDKKYPVADLQRDLILLQNNLEQVHAGLYTYASKETYNTFFQDLSNQITQPMTQIEFYRLVLPLHNLIRNGHTLIIPPSDWSHAVENSLPHFPFDIYQDGEKIYVLRNLSNSLAIHVGDEIISINGVAAIQIFNQLVNAWTKDGYNKTYPSKIVHMDFSEFYANIIGTPAKYELVLQQQGSAKSFQIEGLPIVQMRKNSLDRYQYKKQPWYNSEEDQAYQLSIEGNTATLTLPTFAIGVLTDYKIDYKNFFQSAFAEINAKSIENLIIDIRENGGGNGDVTTELFSYLYDQPFQLMEEIHCITNKLPNKKYYSGNAFFLRLQMVLALRKKGENKYVPTKFALKKNGLSMTEKQPTPTQFKGNLYVLTSGWSFSASGLFTSLLKTYNKGIIIGEEAGGNPYVQTGDFEQMLTLPNSGVRINIPLFYEKMKVNFENTGQGMQPHYPVRNSISEELAGTDSVMEFTMNLINHPDQTKTVLTQKK